MVNMNQYNIEELLESDDELPTDYYEVPAVPAYQIDSRFDMIQFKWINPTLQLCKTDTNTEDTQISHLNISKQLNKPILSKGVLNKQDLFCIKSVQGLTGNLTFIWLINFFLYKDLQANYWFLKSCLVL